MSEHRRIMKLLAEASAKMKAVEEELSRNGVIEDAKAYLAAEPGYTPATVKRLKVVVKYAIPGTRNHDTWTMVMDGPLPTDPPAHHPQFIVNTIAEALRRVGYETGVVVEYR